MKFTALLASAFVATAVQASEVTLKYCAGQKCTDASVESEKCVMLEHPGSLTSIQNTADCSLFPVPGCNGPPTFAPRGANLLHGAYVASVVCYEPEFSRNLAPAVQDEPVEVDYCLEGGPCHKEFVAPGDCADLIYPGYLKTIQNTANCRLFEYENCGGRNFVVKRGAHDIKELRGKIVGSFVCGEPGLPRTLAPAVQDEPVEVDYCLEGGPCRKEFVAPEDCADLIYPGYLKTIQNTADCRLFEHRGCWGRNFVVKRGAHDINELRGKIVGSFVCGEPGLLRTLAPAVQSEQVALYYCTENGCTNQYVESEECTFLETPGRLTSIQNTADCQLFAYPGCGGHSITVYRGTTLLKNPFAITIKCSEPGFQRSQRPMRRH